MTIQVETFPLTFVDDANILMNADVQVVFDVYFSSAEKSLYLVATPLRSTVGSMCQRNATSF